MNKSGYFGGGFTGGSVGKIGASPPRSLFILSGFNLNSRNSSVLKLNFFMAKDLIIFPTLF
jgi:hypothetical protein